MLFTLQEPRRLCPFLDRPCVGEQCANLRASRLVDRRDGLRLFFCGVGGEKGAWNPWAASAKDIVVPAGGDDQPAAQSEAQPHVPSRDDPVI